MIYDIFSANTQKSKATPRAVSNLWRTDQKKIVPGDKKWDLFAIPQKRNAAICLQEDNQIHVYLK